MTRELGVAIYPDKMSSAEIKSYLNLAWANNFTRAYLTFLPINLLEQNQETLLPLCLKAIAIAKAIGFNVTIDINERVLKLLGLDLKDLSWFQNHGVDIVRFDLPIDSKTTADLSYNQANIKIELQMSNDNFALQDILSYDPNKNNLVGCHNFYPQNHTGLSLEYFYKTSEPFLKNNIKTTAYLSSNNPKAFCSWPHQSGTPTLEVCREMNIVSQAKYMWTTKIVDDLIIANCPATKVEIESLGKLNRDILELDVDLETDINSLEKEIVLNRLHQNRGDVNEHFIRSTATRVEFKNQSNPARIYEKKYFEPGDILIGNDLAGLYKFELQIVNQKILNTKEKNYLGYVKEEDLEILNILKSWQRFFFRT
ncbi:hypothetical protein SSABA_v1c08940 [Spiroplasma sabaudiense Ar-1343]|uniref:Outer surface protein n=1 Tax=Spiroplasma sabaudiense Ar-1343 TaxID=1276257 RepID=W6AAV3_9MOLU|nr:MupG family TIM beta-alpha barrel fold protein [Spiroplasma sabaudiense]AHI54293.1 hypothetical protein SSABA_v1c08940 [Spiroplasma sabaudiense Ar-1343]